MKSNEKRKVFKDAIDLLSAESTADNGIQMIPVDIIVPFHNHPFRMYEGERLEDMIESIREHGVLNPVIVQKKEGGYEMLAGHNRWNASKIVGKKTVPAIVKEDLSEEEAYVYVIETNLMQRSFTDLLPSEKAAVLAERYEKISCQGKRNDILEEIARLEGKEVPEACGHSDHRKKSRDLLGREYELSGSSVARLLRINKLIPEFKEMVDKQRLAFMVAIELSDFAEQDQRILWELCEQDGVKLNKKLLEKLKEVRDGWTVEKIRKQFVENKKENTVKKINIKISSNVYERFLSQLETKEIDIILEQALEAWFEKKYE